MARRREEESSLSGYEHEFLRASEELKTAALRNEVYLGDAQKIKFYALFKQATDGDCTKPQPSAFKPVERAKWNGWKGLEGMDMTVAKRRYVLQVIELVPSFKMPTEKVQDQAIVEEPTAPAAQAAATPESVPTVAVAATSAPTEPAPSPARDDSLPDPPQPSRPVVRGSATTRQASLIERHQRRADVPSLSYPLILLEMLAFVLGATILLLGGTKFLVPLCNQVAMEHFGVESCDGLKSLAPVFWFSLGYGLVAVLRGKVFQWRLLTGQFVWVSATSPLRRLRRFRRREQQQESPEELEKARFLQELGIHLVKKPEGPHDRWVTPRLELLLPSDPDALSCGHATVELPYTLEQTADVFYRKFKEPLPDPANEMLVGLDDVDEQHFDEWEAVYRRRAMRFRNVTPTMFKRFVNSEFIEYVEHSLFDKRNRVFYVYAKNVSFQNMGFIEDYSIYHATEGKPEWTTLTQFARVHITSSSVGFFRSQIESFISSVYGKQATKARAYHLLRLQEECGDPQGLPVPPRAESA